MATRRHCSRTNFAFADGSIQGRLADAHELGRRLRADEPRAGDPFGLLVQKPAVPTWGDDCRLEQSSRHGAKNRRSADAEAGC